MTSSCRRPDGPPDAAALCRLGDIPDGGSLCLETSARPLVLVRRDGDVWGYVNRCPHFSVPLQAANGAALTYERQVIMCAHHSALFRFEDGVCIEGPCQGAGLEQQPLRIADGQVYAA